MVTVGHVEYTVAVVMPVPRDPPDLAVYAPSVRRMICPGDTVRISSSDQSSTLGRVIDIANQATISQSNILAHRDILLHGTYSALIQIQLIMCKHESLQIHPEAIWPYINDVTKMATRGLKLKSPTQIVSPGFTQP